MKYWALPSGLSDIERQEKLNLALTGGDYIYSLKTDGNLIRAVITPDRFALQTRGRGRNSGVFGEIQDKNKILRLAIQALESHQQIEWVFRKPIPNATRH